MAFKRGAFGTNPKAIIQGKAHLYQPTGVSQPSRKAFDLLKEGIQIIDFNWRYVYVNNTIVSYEKTSRENILGTSLLERYKGFKETDVFNAFADCMYTRESQLIEVDFEWSGTAKKRFRFNVEPVEEGILIVSTDYLPVMEERPRKETVWEFDKKNLTALINNTTDFMWSVDRNFNLIISNEPLNTLLTMLSGRTPQKGDYMLSYAFSPEQAARFKSYYERAFAGETVVETEYMAEPAEGWSEISYCPIRRGDMIIGAACHARDISALKKAERELKRSEKGLRESQKIAHLGNWEMNLATGIGIWSEETCRIYGLDPEDNVKNYSDWIGFIHPEDLAYVYEMAEEAKKNFSDMSIQHRILLKDGTVKHIYSKCKYELDANGTPVRLHGITHDVTDRKMSEEEREKMVADVIQRSKKLEQFTYIVSHNLRAPIANILGISHVLKGSISEEDRLKSLEYLFVAVEQLDETVKDLNKILQVRAEITENKETVDLQELTNNVTSSIQHLIKKENVKIRTDFSGVNQVLTIKTYIHSIFYNLISNSIKYKQTNLPPIIEISGSVKNGKIRIVFQDNGIGIDLKQHGDKLFGLYKRFHTTIEGKGIGLFMVKTQTEAIGGSINVKSEPNVGTRFTLELPLA